MSDFIIDFTNSRLSDKKTSHFPENLRVSSDLGDNKEEGDQKCNFHYFHLYLKIWYYCGVFPFKLHFSQHTGHYQLSKPNKFHKVRTIQSKHACNFFLCYICLQNVFLQAIFSLFWLLSILFVISLLRNVWKGREATHRVMHYFRLTRVHVYILMPIVYFITIHLRPEKMQQMLEAISHNLTLNQSHSSPRKMKMV